MTSRTNFTDAEWDLLTDLPRMAAFGAMAAEESGPVTSTRELWASMAEMAPAARSKYQENVLIQEVTRIITRPDDDDEMPMTGWTPDSGEDLGQAIVAKTLQTAPLVRELLASKATPEDGAGYTAWVLGIARAGCQAARGGLFGLSGKATTEAEDQYLTNLAAALGTA